MADNWQSEVRTDDEDPLDRERLGWLGCSLRGMCTPADADLPLDLDEVLKRLDQ